MWQVEHLGDLDALLDEIERFLTGARPPDTINRVLVTVLVADIAGSANRAADLGDRRRRKVLERHYALVRRELRRFEGREIKPTGDGFLATFTAPSRAIACACAIRESAALLGLEVRAGLHTGECEISEDAVSGLAVHIGARVAALAGPGDVLVTGTVKDLVAGSDLTFTTYGLHKLRGVPGEWPLYVVQG